MWGRRLLANLQTSLTLSPEEHPDVNPEDPEAEKRAWPARLEKHNSIPCIMWGFQKEGTVTWTLHGRAPVVRAPRKWTPQFVETAINRWLIILSWQKVISSAGSKALGPPHPP